MVWCTFCSIWPSLFDSPLIFPHHRQQLWQPLLGQCPRTWWKMTGVGAYPAVHQKCPSWAPRAPRSDAIARKSGGRKSNLRVKRRVTVRRSLLSQSLMMAAGGADFVSQTTGWAGSLPSWTRYGKTGAPWWASFGLDCNLSGRAKRVSQEKNMLQQRYNQNSSFLRPVPVRARSHYACYNAHLINAHGSWLGRTSYIA